MPIARVHLVRHGESTWNVEHRVLGQTPHPPLTPAGREQATQAARDLSQALSGMPADQLALWCSDLVRARQTAEPIAAALGLNVNLDALLREQHLGSMQGRLTSELTAEPTPPGQHIADIRWAGGESTADLYARLGSFFAREFADATPRVSELVVVSHGDAIRAAHAWLTGRSHRDLDWRPIRNGDVWTVDIGPNHGDPTGRLGHNSA